MQRGRRSLLTAGVIAFSAGIAGCLSSLGGSNDPPRPQRQSVLHTDESPLSRTIAGGRAPFNAAVF